MSSKTLILEHTEILQKIKRLAWELYENNHQHGEVVVIGIKERGKIVSDLISAELRKISDLTVHAGYIELNAEKPLESKLENIDFSLKDKVLILVDDVLNSGRTLMLATVPLLIQNPAGLQTVILANRDHKKFAISADYVGISLATTLHEHISFSSDKSGEYFVALS